MMEEFDIVIVGGGPAGLSAAIFTQLDGWKTLILESDHVGGQAAIAYTVMNYPGFPPGDGAVLVENLEGQVTSPLPAGVGAELRQENVFSIDFDDKIVKTNTKEYRTKAIILSMGSNMKKLGVPGEREFSGRGVSYCAKRDCEMFGGKRVFVIGGGNTTAKSALIVKNKTDEVALVHRRESLRAYGPMIKRLQKEGVDIWYNTEVKEIRGNEGVNSVVVLNNKTDEEREVLVDWVVICVGTEPNVSLVQGTGLDLKGDYIKIDEHMMTNKKGIFACGEITGCHRHIINAAAEGASAGMAASEYLALEKVKRKEMFKGSINGKYAEEYLAMLR
jgi:thioredoxin reductase (NADPH)